MSGSRRKFLKAVGLGAMGTAGFLSAERAQAGLFRRRGGCCPCPPGGPGIAQLSGYKQESAYANVSPGYPYPTFPVVSYVRVTPNGDFYSWGKKLSSVTNLRFQVTDDNSVSLGVPDPTAATLPGDDPATTWAMSYKGVTPDLAAIFYLTVRYQIGGVDQTPELWGPYTTQAL
jgi:hypothetical protein